MVTFHVIGHRGMLGQVVQRRWQELGGEPAPIATADHIVNCVYPDDWTLLNGLPLARVIQPSTDAISEADGYAVTKRAVERLVKPHGVVIRSGLVDLRKQAEVSYTNWFVNPLTPLEWADLAWRLRTTRGLHLDGREMTSKHGVAVACHEVFGTVKPHPTLAPLSRFRIVHQSSPWPPLREALETYRGWLG